MKTEIETICAWCFPNDHRPGVSHGICEKHRREQEAELVNMRINNRANAVKIEQNKSSQKVK